MTQSQRSYRIGDKIVNVEEILDFLAVRQRRPLPQQARRALQSSAERVAPNPKGGLPGAELQALQDAGWELWRVASPQGTSRLITSLREQGCEVGSVFLLTGTRLMIGTDRLTVKLRDDIDAEAARRLLVERGMSVSRQLKMSPNLFVVRVKADSDPLEVAGALGRLDDVEFAEPQMIERVGAR